VALLGNANSKRPKLAPAAHLVCVVVGQCYDMLANREFPADAHGCRNDEVRTAAQGHNVLRILSQLLGGDELVSTRHDLGRHDDITHLDCAQ